MLEIINARQMILAKNMFVFSYKIINRNRYLNKLIKIFKISLLASPLWKV